MNTVQAKRRLGRRGAFLLTGGIVWVLEALQVIRHHPPVPHIWLMSHGWWAQAIAWAIAGLIAIWFAFRRPGRDAAGWAALCAMGVFVVAIVVDYTFETVWQADWWGTLDALLSGGINFGVLAWVIIAAGWAEPVKMPKFEKGGDR